MARKKKHPEHVNHERWLVSYGDFITLLFAFFVVMYATANPDEAKTKAAKGSMVQAFESFWIFPNAGQLIGGEGGSGDPGSVTSIDIGMWSTGDEPPLDAEPGSDGEGEEPFPWDDQPGELGGPEEGQGQDDSPADEEIVDEGPQTQPIRGIANEGSPELHHVYTELQKLFHDELAQGKVDLREEKRGIVISLAEAGFFDSGSATISRKSLDTINRIAANLDPLKRKNVAIRVEGHTDNKPIYNRIRFPRNNLELSTARANAVIEYMVDEHGFSPQNLIASGFGEWRPVASNDTPEGRARNRRVDIVILTNEAAGIEAGGSDATTN